MNEVLTILIVATGKYKSFVPDLVESIQSNFNIKGCFVKISIFTEDIDEMYNTLKDKGVDTEFSRRIIKVDHKPWPHATLKRFDFFKDNYEKINESDYYFYIDADTLVKGEITNSILGERVAVQHCGFMKKRGTYETNPASLSYVAPDEGTHYFGGGFWGFSFVNFWHMVYECSRMIDMDGRNGIVPVHNDESVLNRYLIDNPPTKILTPSYHYPQGNIEKYKAQWPEEYPCKILLLDKNHEEMRSI